MPTDDNQHGPDRPCRRFACATEADADHLGGAHLDPTDRAHYDGIGMLAGAMPHRVRDAISPLLKHVGAYDHPPAAGDTPLRAHVETALDAACREIDRLRQQVAHVSVDADHRVRDAMARSTDCDQHGEEIQEQARMFERLAADRDRVEAARLALLAEHQAIIDFLDTYDSGRAVRDVPALVESLRTMTSKATRAHRRALNGGR